MTSLRQALRSVLPLAEQLFGEIGERTWDGEGICRAPYGPGEQIAAEVLAEAAGRMGLDIETDCAGNLYMSLPGTDPDAKPNVVGSHMDSVPRGGNFDGLAGIVAGLLAIAALQKTGIRPRRGVTVMGIRAEENAWFGAQHVGSRLALGTFDAELLDSARRIDTGRTLGEHIAAAGFDTDPLRRREAYLAADRINAFIELHIEQGPVLESGAVPVGIVTGIRGNLRCGDCRCIGEYGHAGTQPRELRKDAVMATAKLVADMDRLWETWVAEEKDMVLTFGQFTTDHAAHSITTVPGEVRFSVDARSHSSELLAALKSALLDSAERIGRIHGVSFRFGTFSQGQPTAMDSTLRRCLAAGAAELRIPHLDMPSGAGHDAADFALAGVPAAMIFVRNANGSHNPAEAMAMDDFALGTELLLWYLARPD